MLSFVIGWVALVALGAGVCLFAALRAPIGYEDETGFHYGPETGTESVENPNIRDAVPGHA